MVEVVDNNHEGILGNAFLLNCRHYGHYTSRCPFLGTNNDDGILENIELEDDNMSFKVGSPSEKATSREMEKSRSTSFEDEKQRKIAGPEYEIKTLTTENKDQQKLQKKIDEKEYAFKEEIIIL